MKRDRHSTDERLREVLAIHFDPKWGAPYWLARAAQLGFDPRSEIRSLCDLSRLGSMTQQELLEHPLDHFLPRAAVERKADLIVAQTGGTLGRPVWTAYSEDEFHEAFVEPFIAAAVHVEFPMAGTWLYVGPSGPHIIGRAAEAIARRSGSPSPFCVDFDVRWARKLPGGSFAARRYLRHIVNQAAEIMASQPIDTLFTTPAVLRCLSPVLTPAQRERVRGVHYGGMALDPAELEYFQRERLPGAVHLSGYGNTLFGCCLELSVPLGRRLQYYPYGDRLIFDLQSDGRLSFTRLDRTMLLINMLERDTARLVDPPPNAPPGFRHRGVESPATVALDRRKLSGALY